ncbi:hypothetical protein SLA2020_476540 [Shorea laevis]
MVRRSYHGTDCTRSRLAGIPSEPSQPFFYFQRSLTASGAFLLPNTKSSKLLRTNLSIRIGTVSSTCVLLGCLRQPAFQSVRWRLCTRHHQGRRKPSPIIFATATSSSVKFVSMAADPNAQYFEELLYFQDNNSTFEDLSIQEPFPQPPSIPQQGIEIGGSNDLFENGGIWTVQNDPNNGNFHGESSNNGIENVLSPFSCSFCQVLREIVHTNGTEITTLEIHGRLGMFFHAILDVQGNVDTPSPSYHCQIFDFCKKSMEEVKQFLVQYCLDRMQAGFFLISDPLSTFYEALCVGFVWAENLQHPDEFIPSSSSNSGDQERKDNDQTRAPETSLAEQRKRAGKMKLKDVGNYFHLPIEEAAKKMRLCPTVVKKICRRDGLTRWPHRKIKSMERQMSNWASNLRSNDPQVRVRAQTEIQRLQQEIEKICQGGSS